MKKLEQPFFLQDTLTVAKGLVGKYLVHILEGERLVCRITETEGYTGPLDKACHAYGNRRTERTQALYLPGGHAYVFMIYGMYDCFNVVTESEGTPCAVLVRGAYPVEGLDAIACRRFQLPFDKLSKSQRQNLLNGPGKLCIGMGISRKQNKASLLADDFFLYEDENAPRPQMAASPRINIDYAQEYTNKPWRYYDTQYVKK